MYRPIYFDIEELVCPHVFYKYGEWVLQFFDERLLKTMDFLREKHGPIFANNWHEKPFIDSEYVQYIRGRIKADLPIIKDHIPEPPKGLYDERGVRCNLCNLNVRKTTAGVLYLSSHSRWSALDFEIQGKTAEEVRQWILNNRMPYPVRLERGVSWVHLDVVNSDIKVQIING